MSGKMEKTSIEIAGKRFPLKLDSSEKARLRSIEQEINNKITQYQSQFANMSLKDSITLVLISYAFELKQSQSDSSAEVLEQTLNQLESVLDSKE